MKDYIEKIEQAGNTLLSLINDTLDLQKIETGAIKIKYETVQCNEIVQGILTTIQPLIEASQIDFVFDNSRAVMATIETDAMRVQEIFINLLSNAIKFTPAGGRVEFIVECLELEENCVHDKLIVRDTGIGMSKAFLPKLFEPFSQERTADTAHIGGSGLGLSIVRRLVDMLDGRIEVQSELGKGTEFIVYLDFKRVTTAAVSQPNMDTDLEVLHGKTVLLCEDNLMNREIAQALLETQGVQVVFANNGQEGVDIFCNNPAGTFDIILMDIRMPILNGYEATKKIRASQAPGAKTIPIIAMSADAYEDDVKRCMDIGMNAHVAKPINSDKLFREMAYCLITSAGATLPRS